MQVDATSCHSTFQVHQIVNEQLFNVQCTIKAVETLTSGAPGPGLPTWYGLSHRQEPYHSGSPGPGTRAVHSAISLGYYCLKNRTKEQKDVGLSVHYCLNNAHIKHQSEILLNFKLIIFSPLAFFKFFTKAINTNQGLKCSCLVHQPKCWWLLKVFMFVYRSRSLRF